MNISKKQLKLVSLVEKCGYLFRNEINKQEYPDSMIDALIKKGILCEYKNKISSNTCPLAKQC